MLIVKSGDVLDYSRSATLYMAGRKRNDADTVLLLIPRRIALQLTTSNRTNVQTGGKTNSPDIHHPRSNKRQSNGTNAFSMSWLRYHILKLITLTVLVLSMYPQLSN